MCKLYEFDPNMNLKLAASADVDDEEDQYFDDDDQYEDDDDYEEDDLDDEDAA